MQYEMYVVSCRLYILRLWENYCAGRKVTQAWTAGRPMIYIGNENKIVVLVVRPWLPFLYLQNSETWASILASTMCKPILSCR